MKKIVKDIILFVAVLVVLLVIRIYVASPIMVQGKSMMPTLIDGEKAISYKLGDIKRFDIVPLIAPDDPSLNYIKRVIGLPGDALTYENDQLYINGEPMPEPYLDEYKTDWKNLGNTEPFTNNFTLAEITGHERVPENTYFVLGDNRPNSKDCRDSKVGFIPKENIIGKATVTVWPPSEWRIIK